MNESCIFCSIAKKEIPSHLIYEDEHALAFLDIHPRAPGHVLVIPKAHAETVMDLSDEAVGMFFSAVKNVDRLLVSKLKPDGVTIGINQGAASGQEVAHVHVHLMPRFKDDGGGSIQSVVNNASQESIEEIKKRIVGS